MCASCTWSARRWPSSWRLMRTAPVGRTVRHARCGTLPTWLPERPVAAGRPSTRTPPSPPARAWRTNTGCASAASRPRPWRPSRGASTSRSPASGYPGHGRSGGSATAAAIAAQSVVLPAPAGTVRPCSAAGGLFEAESCPVSRSTLSARTSGSPSASARSTEPEHGGGRRRHGRRHCTPGADYTHVAGTLIFNAGSTAHTIPVPVLADSESQGKRNLRGRTEQPSGRAAVHRHGHGDDH